MAVLQLIICAAFLSVVAASEVTTEFTHNVLNATRELTEEYHDIEQEFSVVSKEINETFNSIFFDTVNLYHGQDAVQEVKKSLYRNYNDSQVLLHVLHCAEKKNHAIMPALRSLNECRNRWPNEQNCIDNIKGIFSSVRRQASDLIAKQHRCDGGKCAQAIEEAYALLTETTIPEGLQEMRRYNTLLHDIPYKLKLCYEDVKFSYWESDTLNKKDLVTCALWRIRKESLLCRLSPFKCEVSKFFSQFFSWD